MTLHRTVGKTNYSANGGAHKVGCLIKKGNRRVMIMHLTLPSLKIQVTGEYSVRIVKNTRASLEDAVSFQTKSSAQPALPYSAPSLPKSGGRPLYPNVALRPVLQPGVLGAHLQTLTLP